jgi:hypothetical protein
MVADYLSPISNLPARQPKRRFLRSTIFWGLAAVLSLLILQRTSGQEEYRDLKYIDSLPMTDIDVASAHRISYRDKCEIINSNETIEQLSFSTALTANDRRAVIKGKSIPAARHSVLSVGLEMAAGEKAKLPAISGGRILDYINTHALLVQARVRRDLLDGKLYYHYRPIAVTVQFRGAKMTQVFQPVIANAVNDFRSLGLFRKSNDPKVQPEELRTVVLVFHNTIQADQFTTKDQYEFGFFRGREGTSQMRLDNHIFATDKDRTELVYLNPYKYPTSLRECSIRGAIAITSYDTSGLIPRDSVTKGYRLNARKRFAIAKLDEYATSQELEGGFAKNVDTLLDAIIDGKLNPDTEIAEMAEGSTEAITVDEEAELAKELQQFEDEAAARSSGPSMSGLQIGGIALVVVFFGLVGTIVWLAKRRAI